jgi:hypothetical protein
VISRRSQCIAVRELFTGYRPTVVIKSGQSADTLLAEILSAQELASPHGASSGLNLSPPDAKSWESGDKFAPFRSKHLSRRQLWQKSGGEEFAVEKIVVSDSFARPPFGAPSAPDRAAPNRVPLFRYIAIRVEKRAGILGGWAKLRKVASDTSSWEGALRPLRAYAPLPGAQWRSIPRSLPPNRGLCQ